MEVKNVLEDLIDQVITENVHFYPKYNCMVVSGGAMKGLASLGSLQYLHENNLLSNITKYIGVSIGACISYLLAIGFTPVEILVELCTQRTLERLHLNIISLTEGSGAYDWNVIEDFLKKLSIKKVGKYITLQELYTELGKELTCVTYNYTRDTTEYISRKNHPHMSCLTALRMSSNIPVIFSHFKYMDCYYLDGGLINNFPLNCLSSTDVCIAVNMNQKTYGLQDCNRKIEESFKIQNYIYDIISRLVDREGHKLIKEYQDKLNCDIINVKLSDVNSLQFVVKAGKKLDMFSCGYQYTKKQIKNFF